MYSTVQINSEPIMPIGMSFCGFLASWGGVHPASKPRYAKNTMPAPVMTPVQPYSPRTPVFSGMKGDQLAALMAQTAPTMNRITTATLMNTITLLTLADSLIPMISNVVTMAMMSTAGRLNSAAACGSVAGSTPLATRPSSSCWVTTCQWPLVTSINSLPAAAESWGGMWIPRSARNETT